MRLKYSIYNNYLEYDNDLVIYNSLSQKIAKTNIDHCNYHCENIETSDKTLISKMMEYGFVVDQEEDEVKKADLLNLDHIFSKKLKLAILPTEKCNFRCKYCYESHEEGTMTEETQEYFIKWLKKNIYKYEGLEVSWFGGEPLLALDVVINLSDQMIKICHEQKIPYSASITSNGFFMTDDVMRKLLKARINVFQITLDGNREQHNSLRHLMGGGETFDTIINNLRNIRDEIKTRTISIIIRTNVSKQLSEGIEEYLEFLNTEFGEDNRFTMYFRPIGDWGGESVNSIRNELTQDIGDLYDRLARSKFKLNYGIYKVFLRDGMCSAGLRNSYVIRASGRINKCTMLLDDVRNDIGYLSEKGKMVIDENKLIKWFHFELSPRCTVCSTRSSCNERTCPAKNFILTEEGKCGYENKYISDVLKLLLCSGMIDEI